MTLNLKICSLSFAVPCNHLHLHLPWAFGYIAFPRNRFLYIRMKNKFKMKSSRCVFCNFFENLQFSYLILLFIFTYPNRKKSGFHQAVNETWNELFFFEEIGKGYKTISSCKPAIFNLRVQFYVCHSNLFNTSQDKRIHCECVKSPNLNLYRRRKKN